MIISNHPNPAEIVRAEGYLYISPDSTIDPDDQDTWGSKLGFSKEASIINLNYSTVAIRKMETGVEVRKILHSGSSPVFNCFLRNYNTNVLNSLFPGFVTGTTAQFPNNLSAGGVLDSLSSEYIYIPNDFENNFAVHIKKGIARQHHSGFFTMSHSLETVFAIYIDCIRETVTGQDSSVVIGKLRDIV